MEWKGAGPLDPARGALDADRGVVGQTDEADLDDRAGAAGDVEHEALDEDLLVGEQPRFLHAALREPLASSQGQIGVDVRRTQRTGY